MIRIGRARVAETQAALKKARRELRKVGNDTIRQVVDRRIVPTANGLAPSPAKGTMVGGGTSRGAYLTTRARGTTRAIVVLTNWGGTVKAPIRPKRKKALSFGGNHPVSIVTTPRHYTGSHWMERAVRLNLGSVRIALARELPAAIQAHIDRGG